MAEYALSLKADEDLTKIYTFSYANFGEDQADAYLTSLDECFALLAERPRIGREIDHVRAGYLRHEHREHSIFYKRQADGIIIMRVLHKGRDVNRHL